jgi:hypothetical protein
MSRGLSRQQVRILEIVKRESPKPVSTHAILYVLYPEAIVRYRYRPRITGISDSQHRSAQRALQSLVRRGLLKVKLQSWDGNEFIAGQDLQAFLEKRRGQED